MVTVSAREQILGRIRSRQGRGAADLAAGREAVAAHLAEHPAGPRPTVGGDLLARFCDRARFLSASVDMVQSIDAVPAAVAVYLNSQQLAPRAVCTPAVSSWSWAASGLLVEARAAIGDDLVGITGAFCAIAETGTLMLLSGRDTPASVSLLPETHIAVLPVSRVVSGMEDAWALLRGEQVAMPRAVNFVSGPSRTADIEQTVTLGAHGPYRVHVILTP